MNIKRTWIMWILLGWVVVFAINTDARAQKINPLSPDYSKFPQKEWEKKFSAFQFKVYQDGGHTLPYRFYQPEQKHRGEKYPLVIFFHGAGERGLDNRTQFQRFAPTLFWQKYPCYVVAPECPARTAENSNAESVWVDTPFGASSHKMSENPTWPMQLAMQLINQIIKDNQVDVNRIYVTGLSMGGFATWEILQREPGLFAAAIPVCGGGDPAYAAKLNSIPIWVFHGGNDHTVPVTRSREMVSAIQAAGGNVKYSEYPGVDHDSWGQTYGNPEVWDWLFSQAKK
jgi:predicted peptidase